MAPENPKNPVGCLNICENSYEIIKRGKKIWAPQMFKITQSPSVKLILCDNSHEPLALDTLLEPVFCKSETSRDIKKS